MLRRILVLQDAGWRRRSGLAEGEARRRPKDDDYGAPDADAADAARTAPGPRQR
jgi:hypothetical protein